MRGIFGEYMKLTLIILSLLSTGLMAKDSVVLDSDYLELPASSLVLEKIDKTPDRVELMVPISISFEVCAPGFDRVVYGANGPECGYDLVPVVSSRGSQGSVQFDRVARSCEHTVCDRYETQTEIAMKRFELIFENYDKDEHFEFSLDEEGNVTLLPMLTSPGCTSLVVYGEKPYTEAAKISLKKGLFSRHCHR